MLGRSALVNKRVKFLFPMGYFSSMFLLDEGIFRVKIIILLSHLLHIVFWLASVIAVNSSVKRVIAYDHRLTKCQFLYISSTFRNILAVSNRAVPCITSMLCVISNFPSHLSKALVTLPRGPITTNLLYV